MSTKSSPTLQGQTILIIGGTSGIGFGVAVASLRAGASRIVLASSSLERVKAATERLKEKASSGNGTTKGEEVEIEGVVLDVKDLKALDRGVKDVGTINHLVLTSGDGYDATFAMDVNKFDIGVLKDSGQFDIRYWGSIQAAKSAVFALGGSIIFTGGSSHVSPVPGMGLSAGINSAMAGVTKGLAVDFAPNVRVNCVAPGLIDTELLEPAPSGTKEAIFQKYTDRTLVKRVGLPEDVAEAYVFLMKCGYITGETINVNGGQGLAAVVDSVDQK